MYQQKSSTWFPTSSDQAFRLVAGRRAYTEQRQLQARRRHVEVLCRVKERGFDRGVQAQIAKELGVHRSTITRDIKKIFTDGEPCARCERYMTYEEWRQLHEARERRKDKALVESRREVATELAAMKLSLLEDLDLEAKE